TMPIQPAQLRITDDEFRARCDHLLNVIQQAGYSGVVLFDADYVKYYTGFAFTMTERPMAFVMNASGERGLFVPRLEREHAQMNALVDYVKDYAEYPGKRHPIYALVELLAEMNITSTVGADEDGYPWVFGYRGEKLSVTASLDVQPIRAQVEDQMMIKSEAEIALLRESCVW